mgnify:CR=1 FL=1
MTHFIRFLSKKEIYKFQNLIKKNCKKKDHIFTKNSKLILFYYNYHNKKITNILGLFINSKLGAVLGLIPNNNWDNKLGKDFYIAFLLKSKIPANINDLKIGDLKS